MTQEQQILCDIARDHARLLNEQLRGPVNVPLALTHAKEAQRALECLQQSNLSPIASRPAPKTIDL
jgi:hypothetical protein